MATPMRSLEHGETRPIPRAPTRFTGTLEALFRLHIEPVLLDAEVVRDFHQVLVEYLALRDPLFIVRYVRPLEHGQTVSTPGGRMRPSDNSPAWVFHRISNIRSGTPVCLRK
jgi:hypothetical protein